MHPEITAYWEKYGWIWYYPDGFKDHEDISFWGFHNTSGNELYTARDCDSTIALKYHNTNHIIYFRDVNDINGCSEREMLAYIRLLVFT